MNNLKLTVYHPSLDLISDRTFRFLLKKLSSLSREIQTAEVLYLINQSDLSASEKQSLRDRVQPPLEHIPAYYIENVRIGSIEVAVALTAVGIWLLQTTIGKSVEEAWKKTRMHEYIIQYLSSDKRRNVIQENVDSVVGNWPVDRFLVERIEKEIDSDGDISVKVFLRTPEELEKVLEKQKVDVEFVVNQGKKKILEIEKASKGPRKRKRRDK